MNIMSKDWFLENEKNYESHVKEPFEHLLGRLYTKFSKEIGSLTLRPQTICRPLRPSNKVEEKGLIKNFSSIRISEKRTSRFEWNPGIFIQFGARAEDNFIGMGMYMLSSRQLKKLRAGICSDYKKLNSIVTNKKLISSWGGIGGELYKRFPAGYEEDSKEAKYLKYKQFYIGRHLKRSEVKRKDFFDQTIEDFKVGMPLFQWIRKTVGTYDNGKTR